MEDLLLIEPYFFFIVTFNVGFLFFLLLLFIILDQSHVILVGVGAGLAVCVIIEGR